MNAVRKIPGTNRQSLKAVDGSPLQRCYVYLPASVWQSLQESARRTGTSVSQIIELFANSGAVNLKDQPHGKAKIIGNE